jgi:ABC-2 type transport system ATP-binding protein
LFKEESRMTQISRAAPAIEARALVKTYDRGRVKALDGLGFSVESGTIFGLLGPNGAGKSTTVKILTTLSQPDGGSARVAGFDVLERPADVRRAIGSVAQRSGVDIEATGRENLLLQARVYGLSGRAARRRAAELLERFGLAEAADRVARTYSGGMKRRLDIAMGLVHRPQVLFLDEPTTGLDPEVRSDIWEEIASLAHDGGITILLTTHYLEEADRLASQMVIVDEGRVVAQGSPDELKEELHGDSVLIELDNGASRELVEYALRHAKNVRELTFEGHMLRARVDHGATAAPPLLAALDSSGARVKSLGIARPSLDDVYLSHTGRSFNMADRNVQVAQTTTEKEPV